MCQRATHYGPAIALAVLTSSAPAANPTVAVCRPGEFDAADHEFVGRLEPADAVEVRAPASGVVKSVSTRAGASVHKGDVLFECAWPAASTGTEAAEAAVRDADEELKRATDRLAQARKLAESGADALAKDYAKALDELKDPLTEMHTRLLALLKKGLPPGRREAAQRLFAALEGAIRLANARTGTTLDVAYERQLEKLQPALAGALRYCTGGAKGSPEEQCSLQLQALQKNIDHLLLLSRARSKEGLDELAAARDVAEATLKNRQASAAAQRHATPPAQIVAPADGRVLRVGVRTGDRIDGDSRSPTLLCVLVPAAAVRVAFDIDEPTLELLHKQVRAGGQQKTLADVPVHLALPDDGEFALAGTLSYVDSRIDPKTHRLRCRATFTIAKPALLDAACAANGKGEPVRVRLTIGPSRKMLLVPGPSVLTDAAGKTEVIVVNDSSRIEYRTVKAGADYGGLREIKEGLQGSDQVVVGVSPRRDEKGAALEKRDFFSDLRARDLKPGTLVAPLAVPLPEPEPTARPKP